MGGAGDVIIMYVNEQAGPDGTGLNQPNPEQSSQLHFTCMCHNARAPPTAHFSKMTSFSHAPDPVNFQTHCMCCWSMTYFNRGNMQGFQIKHWDKNAFGPFVHMHDLGDLSCNELNQTSRGVSMVYCISQNNSKQLWDNKERKLGEFSVTHRVKS